MKQEDIPTLPLPNDGQSRNFTEDWLGQATVQETTFGAAGVTEDILMDELEEMGILEDDDADSGRIRDDAVSVEEIFPLSLVRAQEYEMLAIRKIMLQTISKKRYGTIHQQQKAVTLLNTPDLRKPIL